MLLHSPFALAISSSNDFLPLIDVNERIVMNALIHKCPYWTISNLSSRSHLAKREKYECKRNTLDHAQGVLYRILQLPTFCMKMIWKYWVEVVYSLSSMPSAIYLEWFPYAANISSILVVIAVISANKCSHSCRSLVISSMKILLMLFANKAVLRISCSTISMKIQRHFIWTRIFSLTLVNTLGFPWRYGNQRGV